MGNTLFTMHAIGGVGEKVVVCVPACESESGSVWGRERGSVPGDAAVFPSAEGQLAKLARLRLCAPKRFAAASPALPTGSALIYAPGTGECRVAFRFWFCFVLSLRRAAAFEAPTSQSTAERQPYRFAYRAQNIPATSVEAAADAERCRVAGVFCFLFSFPPSFRRSCVSPRSSCLRTITHGRAREGAFRFACPAGGGGRLGETPARQPASGGCVASPLRRQRWSLPEATAKCDGAAFVRPRVSVPPAEIGWNERARDGSR